MNQFLKKSITTSFLGLGALASVKAQTYIQTIPNSNYFSIIQSSDDHLVLAGRRDANDTMLLYSKYSLGGVHLNSQLISSGRSVSLDEAHANNILHKDGDSVLLSIYVADGTQGGVLGAFTKLDNNGNIDFYKRSRTGIASGNVRSGLAATFRPENSNNYINVGWTNPGVPTAPFDYGGMIQKTDLNGNVVWNRFYRTGFQFFFLGTDGADRNSYTVAGGSGFSRLLNVDTSGAINWSYSFKAGGTNTDILGLKTTADSGYIHVGWHVRTGGTDRNAYIMKMDKDATIEWAYSIGGTSADEFTNVVATADGGFVAVGKTASYGAGQDDAWIVKFNDAGLLLWAKTIGEASSNEHLYSVVETTTGSFVAVGKQDNSSILVSIKQNGVLDCSDLVTPLVENVTTTSTLTNVSYATDVYNASLTETPNVVSASLSTTTTCSLKDWSVYDFKTEHDVVYSCSKVSVTAQVKNDGSDTMTDVVLGLRVNGTTVTYDTLRATVAPGLLSAHTFDYEWEPGVLGLYELCVFVVDPLDEHSANDTLCKSVLATSITSPIIQQQGLVLSTQNTYESYQWYLDGNAIPGATAATHTPVAIGTYTVEVEQYGCVVLSNAVQVRELSLQEAMKQAAVQVFPVPFAEKMTIKADRPGSVTIYSIDGKEILRQEIERVLDVATDQWSAGTYIIKVQSDNHDIIIKKVVKY